MRFEHAKFISRFRNFPSALVGAGTKLRSRASTDDAFIFVERRNKVVSTLDKVKKLLSSDPTPTDSNLNDDSTLTTPCSASTTTNIQAANSKVKVDVDFHFDPVLNQHLIAKNADFMKNETMKKYWRQRYRLFTRFDRGILMDEGR